LVPRLIIEFVAIAGTLPRRGVGLDLALTEELKKHVACQLVFSFVDFAANYFRFDIYEK
jgi:hypothetical protein